MPAPELEIYEKKVRDVLDPTNLEFHAIIARLSVLFEDLRIEEYASRPEKLEELDIIGKSYRKMYFLRRSIATLVEFASAIEMLDQRRPASGVSEIKEEVQQGHADTLG